MRRRPVALVTGASRGIGRQTALTLAREGYDVAFTARTGEEGTGTVPPRVGTDRPAIPVPGSLATMEAELAAYGGNCLPVPMDLLDRTAVEVAADTVHRTLGPVDLLVNNAVAHLPGGHDRLLELDPDVARDTMIANFLNQLALTQSVLPVMVDNGGGTIINLCSGSATTDPVAPPGEGGWGLAYAASKAAFGRLGGAVNVEYSDRGVRAFNVDPGFVLTEAGKARGGTAAIVEHGFATNSSQAPAEVIAWLARSEEANRFLGKVVWSPKLAADLDLDTDRP